MKEVLENISKRIHLISVELGRLQEDIRLILEVKTVSPFTKVDLDIPTEEIYFSKAYTLNGTDLIMLKADKEMDVPVIDPANL